MATRSVIGGARHGSRAVLAKPAFQAAEFLVGRASRVRQRAGKNGAFHRFRFVRLVTTKEESGLSEHAAVIRQQSGRLNRGRRPGETHCLTEPPRNRRGCPAAGRAVDRCRRQQRPDAGPPPCSQGPGPPSGSPARCADHVQSLKCGRHDCRAWRTVLDDRRNSDFSTENTAMPAPVCGNLPPQEPGRSRKGGGRPLLAMLIFP